MNALTTADTVEWSNESGAPFPAPVEASRPPSATEVPVERDANRKALALYGLLMGDASIHPIPRRDVPQSSTVIYAVALFSLPERSVSTVLDAYAAQLPDEIAVRIRELDETPYGVEFDEDPMNPDSVECFLKCFINLPRTEKLPELSASSSGTLYATWDPEPGTSVSARFFPSGTIWVALFSDKSKPKAWEVSAEDVRRKHSLLPVPGII